MQEIEFTLTGSDFESQLLLYKLLREYFPKTYAARLRLRPAALVRLHLENEYPRASVTTRLGRSTGKDAFYGPFSSRAAAEKFASDALDFFKMRRCVDDLHPDPSFPGCVYSEMKMCLAPCYKGCGDAEYHAEVSRVQAFFDTAGQSLGAVPVGASSGLVGIGDSRHSHVPGTHGIGRRLPVTQGETSPSNGLRPLRQRRKR